MKRLIYVITIAILLAGCKAEEAVPTQAKAWCQYNDYRNNAYREEGKKWDAMHPRDPSPPLSYQEKMVKRIEQDVKTEQRRIFGDMRDEDVQLLDAHALKDGWYQRYCIKKD